MNERELRLLYSIREIVRTIHQGIHAIYDQKRSESNNESPPIKLDISSEVRLPVAISEYYAAEQSEGQKDRRRDRIRLGLETAALGAAILAGVFTFRTLHQVQRQADAAQNQVTIMQKQLESADRPWIKPELSISGDVTLDGSGLHMTFDFQPRNVGHSPAQNVWIEAKPVLASMGDNLSNSVKEACDKAARPERIAEFPGYLVFPNDEITQRMSLQLSTENLNSSRYARLTQHGIVPLVVVGCYDYRFGSLNTHHQTGFAFDVLMQDGRVLVMTDSKQLPPNSLRLGRRLFGTYLAN